MKILLLKYNKPTNEAWDNVAVQFLSDKQIHFDTVDLAMFDAKIDQLSYAEVSNVLNRHKDCDFLFMGDIFWPTGQNICRWGQENKVKTLFLQHGQWIYTDNKKSPKYTPTITCFLGKDIADKCKDWPYSKVSQIHVTGSPRYDFCRHSPIEEYYYFAPPVMHELVPGGPSRLNTGARKLLEQLSGIDSQLPLFLHPHYREGDILSLQQMFPKAVLINPRDNALNWVIRSKNVITHRNSTSVIDAIACRKIALLINHNNFSSSYPRGYFEDLANETMSKDDLINTCQYYDDHDTRYEFREQIHWNAERFLLLGNAASRIIRVAKDCIIADGI